jgi:hypothetical protein
VKAISYQYGDTSFTLQFRDSLWTVDGAQANEATVRGILSAVSHYLADDFLDSLSAAPGRPVAILTMGGNQVRFYINKATGKYAVQTSQDAQWFEIQSWKAEQVLKRKKELLGLEP